MTAKPIPPRSLPPGLKYLISAVVGFHLFAVVIMVLAAASGPWWVAPLSSPSPGVAPVFAGLINEYTMRYYLHPLGLDNDYHFESNRTMMPTVRFKILVTGAGENKEFRFPDPKANAWVRYRQRMLAQGLGNDEPYQHGPNPAVQIAPPDQKQDTITFFFPANPLDPEAGEMDLVQAEAHRLKKMGMVNCPSKWALLLVRSYVRFMERKYPEAKVDIVRENRNPVLPALMFPSGPFPDAPLMVDNPPPMYSMRTLTCRFGDGQPKNWVGND